MAVGMRSLFMIVLSVPLVLYAQDRAAAGDPTQRAIPKDCCGALSYYEPEGTTPSTTERVVQLQEDAEENLYLLTQVDNSPEPDYPQYGAFMRIDRKTNRIKWRLRTSPGQRVAGFTRDGLGNHHVGATNVTGLATNESIALLTQPNTGLAGSSRGQLLDGNNTFLGALYDRDGSTLYQYFIGETTQNNRQGLTVTRASSAGDDLEVLQSIYGGNLGRFTYQDAAVTPAGEVIIAGYVGTNPTTAVCYKLNLNTRVTTQRAIYPNTRFNGVAVLTTGEIVLSGSEGRMENGVPVSANDEIDKVWLLRSNFNIREEYAWPAGTIGRFGKVVAVRPEAGGDELIFVSTADKAGKASITKLSIRANAQLSQRIDPARSGQYALSSYAAASTVPPVLALGYHRNYLLVAQKQNTSQVLAGRLSLTLDQDCLQAEPFGGQISGPRNVTKTYGINPDHPPPIYTARSYPVSSAAALAYGGCGFRPVDCFTQNCPARTYGQFTLPWPAVCPQQTAVRVNVRDRLGRLVRENLRFAATETIRIDLTGEPLGTYFVEVRCDDSGGRVLFTSSVQVIAT